jgi:hypothetical protein
MPFKAEHMDQTTQAAIDGRYLSRTILLRLPS